MNGNFEQCLALVLKEEGGYVDNPHDPGGMTNHGVTKTTWESWVCLLYTSPSPRD